ncbi:5791_t:CDS:2, partial [Gigaspora margarita]
PLKDLLFGKTVQGRRTYFELMCIQAYAKEFLFEASFDNEEANSDCSQGPSIGIAAEHHKEEFIFDWQSLKKACKLT